MSFRTPRRSLLGALGLASLAAGGVLAGTGTAHAGPRDRRGRSGSVPPGLRPGGTFDRFVAEQADADRFSGTVLLAHRGRVVLERAYGLADKDPVVPNGSGTLFNLASMGKLFTAVAIVQLVERGQVALHEKLGTYLDGFPAEIAGTVTVHQLLTHTSGMAEYMLSPEWQQAGPQWHSREQEWDGTLKVVRQMPLRFTPGTAYAYSNSGFYALGAIVADVTGQSYWDYVHEHVFAPVGMVDSGWFTPTQRRTDSRIAHLYGPADTDGNRVDVTEQRQSYDYGGPAGGVYSRPRELLAFTRAWGRGRLFGPASTALLSGGKYPVAPEERDPSQRYDATILVGYGADHVLVDGQHVIRRTGGSQACSNVVSIYPDLDWVVLICANYAVDLITYLELQDQLITEHA